jgi:membrane-bound ClpP family serine protease
MLGVAVLLFCIGVFLIVLELFVPSMGVLSLAAGAALVLSIVLAFGESTTWGLVFLGGTLVLVPIALLVGIKVFPSTPIGRRLMLDAPDRSTAEPGRDVSSDPLHDLVGRSGRSLSTLRPAGVIEIDGRRVAVVTDGEWIEADVNVIVTEVEGNRAVVRAEGTLPPADDAAS